jgi:hypothetical protein
MRSDREGFRRPRLLPPSLGAFEREQLFEAFLAANVDYVARGDRRLFHAQGG